MVEQINGARIEPGQDGLVKLALGLRGLLVLDLVPRDEEAEPSDDFILAFARAAVEVREETERRKLTDWGRRHERP